MIATRLLTASLALLAPLALAACSDGVDAVTSRNADPASRLTVTLDRDGTGKNVESWTLTCEPAGGTHPDPATACATLTAAKEPFAPLARDAICTEIYGGPQVATIAGSWRGTAVDARYTRENGCNIARWDAVGAVFPGVTP